MGVSAEKVQHTPGTAHLAQESNARFLFVKVQDRDGAITQTQELNGYIDKFNSMLYLVFFAARHPWRSISQHIHVVGRRLTRFRAVL